VLCLGVSSPAVRLAFAPSPRRLFPPPHRTAPLCLQRPPRSPSPLTESNNLSFILSTLLSAPVSFTNQAPFCSQTTQATAQCSTAAQTCPSRICSHFPPSPFLFADQSKRQHSAPLVAARRHDAGGGELGPHIHSVRMGLTDRAGVTSTLDFSGVARVFLFATSRHRHIIVVCLTAPPRLSSPVTAHLWAHGQCEQWQ
jgi:hypothetical protein